MGVVRERAFGGEEVENSGTWVGAGVGVEQVGWEAE